MNSRTAECAFKEGKFSLDQLRNLLPSFEILEENPLSFTGNYLLL